MNDSPAFASLRASARSAALIVKAVTPTVLQFPRKISPNDSAAIAFMPLRARDCTACSREDPHPKLLSAIKNTASEFFGSSKGCRWPLRENALRSSSKACSSSPLKHNGLHESCRKNAIRVHVISSNYHSFSFYCFDFHFTPPVNSRTSHTYPRSAAAATMAGDIKRVLPVGEPCLPLKLRLEELAHTCPASNLSEFMARHMEHPGCLNSNPASVNTRSRPSATASL